MVAELASRWAKPGLLSASPVFTHSTSGFQGVISGTFFLPKYDKIASLFWLTGSEVGSRVLATPSHSLEHLREGVSAAPRAPLKTIWKPLPYTHHRQTASASPISSHNYLTLKTKSLTSTCGTSNWGHRVNHKNDSMVGGNMPAKFKGIDAF